MCMCEGGTLTLLSPDIFSLERVTPTPLLPLLGKKKDTYIAQDNFLRLFI